MSELIKVENSHTRIRLSLLATTSAIVLAACVASVQGAVAADRPTVWIEGGWHMDSIAGSTETLVPPLDGLTTAGYPDVPTATNFRGQGSGGFSSFTDMENVLGRSSGAEGSISFQPQGSDWVFNISARYGRTQSRRHIQQRADVLDEPTYESTFLGHNLQTRHYTNYVEQATKNTESHTILDFKVGKDVGLGLFGERTESLFSFGARYVQMNMTSRGHSYAAPAVRFYGRGGLNFFGKYQYLVQPDHQNSATTIQRLSNFHGLGPSVSWSNTTGLFGNRADGQIGLDWGINAAVLFGRQRSKVSYSTVAHSYHYTAGFGRTTATPQHKSGNRAESRRATVPNLGGFAGLSYRFPNAKLSAGYRADFFFGAMDRGLDSHKSVTTGFNGPYATIAIGLGG